MRPISLGDESSLRSSARPTGCVCDATGGERAKDYWVFERAVAVCPAPILSLSGLLAYRSSPAPPSLEVAIERRDASLKSVFFLPKWGRTRHDRQHALAQSERQKTGPGFLACFFVRSTSIMTNALFLCVF